MKRILLLCLGFVLCLSAFSKTIHWITFIDTTDPRVGSVDVTGRKYLYSRFINVINSALRKDGYNVAVHDYYGNRTSPENCRNAVRNLKCGSKDIVIFYYIGHGGRPAMGLQYDMTHPWPQLCLAQEDESKFMALDAIHNTLKEKGAKLTVTVGMCCNSRSTRIKPKSSDPFSKRKSKGKVTGFEKRIQSWLKGSSGDVLITSASPTQYSQTYEWNGIGEFDLFTGVVGKVLDSYEYTGNEITWSSFLDDVRTWTNVLSEGDQTPYYRSNVR